MARTVTDRPAESVAGTNHPSGFTSNSNADKYKREVYQVCVAIGCEEDAAKAIVSTHIKNVDDFKDLKVKDVSEMIKAIRAKVEFGIIQAKRLKSLCRISRLHVFNGRDIIWLQVTPKWIRHFEDFIEEMDAHEDGTNPLPEVDKKSLRDITKLEENFIAFLEQFRNSDGVPLSYTVRERAIPEESSTFGDDESKYLSHENEVILRYPIIEGNDGFDHTKSVAEGNALGLKGPFTPKFVSDNGRLFAFVKRAFENTDYWNHCAGYKKNKNGRACFFAIFDFLKGDNYSKKVVDDALEGVKTARYEGEKPSWSAKQHITRFAGHATILQNMEERGLYRGIDNKELCDHFLASIKAPEFASVKTSVLANQSLHENWRLAAEQLTRFIDASPNLQRSQPRKIAEATSAGVRGPRGGGKGRGNRDRGQIKFPEADVQRMMAWIKKEHNLAEGQTNFFVNNDVYTKYGDLEHQAIYRLRGGKGSYKNKAAREGAGKPEAKEGYIALVEALTTRMDGMSASISAVAKSEKKRRKRSEWRLRHPKTAFNSDEEDLFTDDSDGESSVESRRSVSTSASKKRKKPPSNRTNPHLGDHPSPARQGRGGRY